MVAENITKQDQWQKLFGYLLGNQAAWIADIGLKTGLFRAIAEAGDGGVADPVLAERLGFNRRCVAVWCRKDELRRLFAETGFTKPRVATQPLPRRFIILAEK